MAKKTASVEPTTGSWSCGLLGPINGSTAHRSRIRGSSILSARPPLGRRSLRRDILPARISGQRLVDASGGAWQTGWPRECWQSARRDDEGPTAMWGAV